MMASRIVIVLAFILGISGVEENCFRSSSCSDSIPIANFSYLSCCEVGSSYMITSGVCCDCNQDAKVEFSSSMYTVSEGCGIVTLNLLRCGLLNFNEDIEAFLTFSDCTAKGGIDYGPFPSSTIQLIAILPANSPETVFGMIIHEDEVVENSESFSVSMRLLTEQSGATSETVVVIQDNDLPIQSQTTPTPSSTIATPIMVECRTESDCGGSSVTSTIKDCCDHNMEPSGFAYTIPGVDGCNLCPVDFGFKQSTFSGIEQGENYRLLIMIFSGGVQQAFFINVHLNLSGSAGGNDITLVTTRLRFLPGTIEQNIEFSLSVDNIAQELDETFAITLEVPDGIFGPGANIRNRLEGVIIDSDEITFQLSEADYTQNEEPNALLEVLITKGSGVVLANPVYFKVTPMTVDDAIAKCIISEYEDESFFSPNRANYEDFDRTTLFATFPSDNTVLSRELKVPIVDDEIDEADEQVFIIFLEVINATNFNKVNVGRKISIGHIKDDETTRIGFEFESYEVTEPGPDDEEFITNLVYLIRENNQRSEQTYSVDLTVGDPGGNFKPATVNVDYSLGGILGQTKQCRLFPPTVDRIPFVFLLFHDLAVEGTETFQATSAQVTPSGNFPVFQTPSGVTAFATTLIHILDNDELKVGFEELNYTVSESTGTVEVCVIVISPPPTADLDVTVTLSPSTIDGTAEAGSDFTQLTAFLSPTLVFPSSPGSPTAVPRRECFSVNITDDDTIENTESFSLLLQENIFGQQTGATIYPNRIEVFILDEDVPIQSRTTPTLTTPSSTTAAPIMVECRTDHSCGGSSVTSTIKDCCDHDIEPSGFAYTIPGVDGCHLCPVDFGFNQSTFSGIEKGENYRIPIKYFSGGRVEHGFFINVHLNLSGTAGGNDINLVTTRLRFLPGDTQQNIEFSLSVDNIAQELNETFIITLEVPDGIFGPGAYIRNRLEGVIIDCDEITFQLSEVDYTQNEEPNAKMEVLITKGSGVVLANPVYFKVTPMTVDYAITRGVIGEFEEENHRANCEDFDSTTLSATFNDTVSSREIKIPIVDDEIDEADEEVFIIFLEVINATNFNKVNINRNTSIGRIKDDEILAQSQVPTLDPNTMVGCRTDRSCGGSSVTSTIKDCCDHDIEPSGFAYTIPGVDGCNLCPVDLRFNQSTFSGTEQGENYRIPIKFFSGGVEGGVFFNVELNLSGTAGENDITLVTTRLRFLPGTIQQNIEFSLSVDNIAQELDETFEINFVVPDGTFGSGASIRNRLEGVIIDSDEIDFQLSEVDYTQNEEPNAELEVLITKGSGVTLANPVYFKVTPMTVDDAIARGVIGEFENESLVSPNRADYEDFNSTTLSATFTDTVSSRELKVPIVDDDVDEADEQVFIIFLEVINATNINKVNINRNTSIGRIKDDETTRIGFEFESYEVTEPNEAEELITNLVYLIREDNRKSEQTYSVDLTVGDPGGNAKPATIETSNTNQSFDYSFGLVDQTKQNVFFPPTVDRIPFVFSLNPDLAAEGTETFRATSAQVTPSGDFPVFQTPGGVTAFATTLIHILDDDELRVRFEELNYTVSESDGTVEVCVIVISPQPTADLDVTVALSPSTIDGTAEAGSDFTPLTAFLSTTLVFPISPGSPTAGPRRECFDVAITDDNLLENTESFSLLLQEDIFRPRTGATINPNRAEIIILDNDEALATPAPTTPAPTTPAPTTPTPTTPVRK